MSAIAHIPVKAPNGVEWDQPVGLFINNEFVASTGNATLLTIDPANCLDTSQITMLTLLKRTENEICSVQAASAADVDVAVKAASAAFKADSWKKMSGTDRGALLFKLAELIERDIEILATVEAWDNGKTYASARYGDIPEIARVIRYYAGWADKIHGHTIPTHANKLAYTLRQPIGVVGQIIPWNFPLGMAAWKLGPALACGNTLVLKAAEQTPLSALVLAKLVKEAGFPPGVVNIINGFGQDAGAALVSHELVDKVAFTGSTQTGRVIMAQAAQTLKNITLETGGKSPMIIFSDADMEQAVKWAHIGIMTNMGQICTATSRVLVHKDIADKFIEGFVARMKTVSVIGNQWSKETHHGPQVSKAQYTNILNFIEVGKTEGANLVCGGKAASVDGKGFFIEPTVFRDVTENMSIFQNEIFGPVVAIVTFETEEEAVQVANNSVYGLGAAVFTNDLVRAHRVAAEIEAGMVWVNSSQDSDMHVPFGGVKQSGIGRELGEAGLEAYSQTKAVHINLGTRL
ncbi:hypothetical protein TD95_001857 [Thielaviopsis punctulata]|uniref:Aldehyde dehydrogenase domain-containing protein n=1 Tax=Thielaviopsis punctulata TaxID=72032 RepID=A0A0F4ZCI0_9PEZI|nr:hypothetical protein TD95_001857 [Thielaviopsis punctulata]